MYDLIPGLAIVLDLVFFTLYGRHFGISKVKSFVLGVCSMIIYLLLVKFLAWAETGFQYFGSENGIRVYVFIPIFIYLLAKIAKVEPLKLFDMQAPACVLMYGVSHFACVFAGCCHGFAYYEGTTMYKIAYALTGTNMLPLQIFESITGLAVFALIYIIGYRKQFATNGRLFCIWFVTFGTARFFWEFLRDNQKVVIFAPLKQADGYFGLSTLAIWAAAMAIAGVAFYFIIRKYEQKIKQ